MWYLLRDQISITLWLKAKVVGKARHSLMNIVTNRRPYRETKGNRSKVKIIPKCLDKGWETFFEKGL